MQLSRDCNNITIGPSGLQLRRAPLSLQESWAGGRTPMTEPTMSYKLAPPDQLKAVGSTSTSPPLLLSPRTYTSFPSPLPILLGRSGQHDSGLVVILCPYFSELNIHISRGWHRESSPSETPSKNCPFPRWQLSPIALNHIASKAGRRQRTMADSGHFGNGQFLVSCFEDIPS